MFSKNEWEELPDSEKYTVHGITILLSAFTTEEVTTKQAIKIVNKYPDLLELLGHHRKNPNVCIGALSCFKYIHPELHDDFNFMIRAIRGANLTIKYASPRLLNNPKFMENVIKVYSSKHDPMKYTTSNIRSDKSFVLSNKKCKLKWLSDPLKDDPEIGLQVCTRYPEEFLNVSRRLQYDINFVMSALCQNHNIILYVSPLITWYKPIRKEMMLHQPYLYYYFYDQFIFYMQLESVKDIPIILEMIHALPVGIKIIDFTNKMVFTSNYYKHTDLVYFYYE